MTIPDLIAALEAAEGPSRELDRHIARAFGWHRVEPRHTRNKAGGWIAPGDFLGSYSGGSPVLDSLHGTTIHREPPRFTGSLDDAMTLVPERAADGLYWRFILERKPLHSGPAWIAEIREHGKDAGWGIAHTGPLAVCAACLRALPEATREREAGS